MNYIIYLLFNLAYSDKLIMVIPLVLSIFIVFYFFANRKLKKPKDSTEINEEENEENIEKSEECSEPYIEIQENFPNEEEYQREENTDTCFEENIETDKEETDSYNRYMYSFEAKIAQAEDDVKERYEKIKRELLSYGLKSRMSRECETFRSGKDVIAKIDLRGKTLSLYLKLNIKTLENTKYIAEDVSKIQKYKDVPVRLKVKSKRGVKWALELIENVSKENGYVKREYNKKCYPDFKTTNELIKEGKIKVYTLKKSADFNSKNPSWK